MPIASWSWTIATPTVKWHLYVRCLAHGKLGHTDKFLCRGHQCDSIISPIIHVTLDTTVGDESLSQFIDTCSLLVHGCSVVAGWIASILRHGKQNRLNALLLIIAQAVEACHSKHTCQIVAVMSVMHEHRGSKKGYTSMVTSYVSGMVNNVNHFLNGTFSPNGWFLKLS